MNEVQFFVTGFSSFAGVEENPTERLIGLLDDCLEGGSPDPSYRVLGTKVLPCMGHAVREWLVRLYSVRLPGAAAPDAPVVLLHLGVDVGGRHFKLEQQAVNEASFRVPDEAGWQPQRQRVDTHPGLTLSSRLLTDLDAAALAAKLTRRGHEVQPSLDAGRFVCNLTYYLSLLHSQLGRERDGRPLHSLFLHVPPAEVVPLHRQLHLLLDLMHEVAAQLAAQSAATPAAAEAAAAEEQAQATAAVDGGASPSLAAAADEAALPNGATSNTMLVRETAAVQAVAVTEAATRSSGASAAGQPRAPQVAARPD